LATSLLEICGSVASDRLDPEVVRWRDERTYGVVLAADGYPEMPRAGDPIGGLDDLDQRVHVFHAATRRSSNGQLVTAGGRVLTVVGQDREAVYRAAEAITFEGKQLRRDIGVEIPQRIRVIA